MSLRNKIFLFWLVWTSAWVLVLFLPDISWKEGTMWSPLSTVRARELPGHSQSAHCQCQALLTSSLDHLDAVRVWLVEHLHTVNLPEEVSSPQTSRLRYYKKQSWKIILLKMLFTRVMEDAADLDGEGLVQAAGQSEAPRHGAGGPGQGELWHHHYVSHGNYTHTVSLTSRHCLNIHVQSEADRHKTHQILPQICFGILLEFPLSVY